MLTFLKTTVVGGVLFLIPIVVAVFVIGQGLDLARNIADPLAELLPIGDDYGVTVARLLAGIILLILCFAAGLLARTAMARGAVDSLEGRVLSNLPAYDLIKSKVQAAVQAEQLKNLKPVLIDLGGAQEIAFEMERLDNGQVVLFLPGSPDPWSGKISITAPDRIEPIDASMKPVLGILKNLGRGARNHLHTGKQPSEAVSGA